MNIIFIGKFIILYFFYCNSSQAEPIVQIKQGFLKGTIFNTRHRTASAFLGIPYAKPPIGNLRFKNPVPGENWNGIRSAHEEGNVCAQMNQQFRIEGKEDCLYLNVYTPLLAFNSSMDNSTLLPVMVFIHGGGFFSGSGSPSLYGPHYLLDKDVIYVSMNYRLGILGFLTTGNFVSPGNYGMKDQVLALKWVQENIRNFGGNPSRVTIFGGSSGAACVNLHAISSLSDGLFHQYIMQSGTALGSWPFRRKEDYKPYLQTVGENVGCLNRTSELFVKCLKQKSVEVLIKSNPSKAEYFPEVVWLPTNEAESEEAFLTDSPINLISLNRLKDLPSISGTVPDEAGQVVFNMYREEVTIQQIQQFLEKSINNTSIYYYPYDITYFRKVIDNYYFNESLYSFSRDQLLQNYSSFLSDSGFFYPQTNLIDVLAKQIKSPFYFFSFNYFSSYMSTMFHNPNKDVGVPHGAEISYLFSKNPTDAISGNNEKVVNLMVDFWTSFATNGKPTSDVLEDPYLWEPYMEKKRFIQIGNFSNHSDPSTSMDNSYYNRSMEFWRTEFPVFI